MSLDYEIWSVHPLVDCRSFPHAERWTSKAAGWTYVTKNWQIVIDRSVEVDQEDIPPEVGDRLSAPAF